MPIFLLYINKNIIEMPKTVCLPDFEPATHWGWGFLERYCAQRVEPVHLRLPPFQMEKVVPHGNRVDVYEKLEVGKKVGIENWVRVFGIWLVGGSTSLGDRKGKNGGE